MEDARKGLFVVALGLLMVAAESIRETTSVQLASELNVGFELLSSCAQKGSLNWEASELCQGRKPFQLYAAPGCYSYFWCSPELAACTTACPAGTLFNLACSCCQDSTTASAAGFDASTCSSTSPHAPQPQQQQQLPQEVAEAVNARRQLLQAQPEGTQASQPSSSSSDGAISSTGEMRAHARARARAMRRKRREAALRAAAAAAAAGGDSPSSSGSSSSEAASGASLDAVITSDSISSDMLPGGQLFPSSSKRRMARRASRGGVWNSYGKRYSSGGFAGKNIVKEPAVAVRKPSSPAARAAAAAAAAAVVVESAAAQQPAAAAEAAVAAATRADAQQQAKPAAASSSAELRQLLSDTPQAPAAAAAAAAALPVAAHPNTGRHIPVAGRRDVQMKRVQRFAAQAAAAAAAAGDPAEVAATGDALEQAVHGGEHHSFVLNPRLRPMDQKPAAKAIDPEDEQAAPFAAALAVKQQQHQQMKVQQPAKQHSRPAGQQAMRRVPL
uniref:Chitin-binding type-2 domain-containing protein n=1 Tax=Tetradesmus obliquus TaxID=3088 RepID=A0A383VWX1_TETOB|eukprot:jgi/Sobl393_1/11458/SZX69420.1